MLFFQKQGHFQVNPNFWTIVYVSYRALEKWLVFRQEWNWLNTHLPPLLSCNHPSERHSSQSKGLHAPLFLQHLAETGRQTNTSTVGLSALAVARTHLCNCNKETERPYRQRHIKNEEGECWEDTGLSQITYLLSHLVQSCSSFICWLHMTASYMSSYLATSNRVCAPR
jgi:hypothetical protein